MCYNEAHLQLCILVAVEYPLVSYVSLSQSAAYYCDFTAQFIYFATCDCVHENEQYVGTIFTDFAFVWGQMDLRCKFEVNAHSLPEIQLLLQV